VTPYYEQDGVTIYCGDCREVLPALALQAHVAIVDPPYAETTLAWDRLVDGWVEPVAASLAPGASLWLWGSLRSLLRAVPQLTGFRLVQEVVWEKHNGSNALADRFRRVHELAVQMIPSGARWAETYKAPVYTQDATKRAVRRKQKPPQWGQIGAASYRSHDGGPRLMRSVLRVRSEHGRAVHPTQKPLGVLAPLIDYSCPPGGLLLDPMAGSGSTGVYAKASGRRAVLIEIAERHCESAARRLQQGVLSLAAAGSAPQEGPPAP
jgi:site-specific DNA-methyltransferase (adenine-specific)